LRHWAGWGKTYAPGREAGCHVGCSFQVVGLHPAAIVLGDLAAFGWLG
jgi:hypothetical protein